MKHKSSITWWREWWSLSLLEWPGPPHRSTHPRQALGSGTRSARLWRCRLRQTREGSTNVRKHLKNTTLSETGYLNDWRGSGELSQPWRWRGELNVSPFGWCMSNMFLGKLGDSCPIHHISPTRNTSYCSLVIGRKQNCFKSSSVPTSIKFLNGSPGGRRIAQHNLVLSVRDTCDVQGVFSHYERYVLCILPSGACNVCCYYLG